MSSIKEYNTKLKSLKNTQKITKTMKMVAASKLRKAQDAQEKAKLYAQKVTEITSRITATVHSDLHPLLKTHENPVNALIVVITSDRGLCGAFNHNANKEVSRWLEENKRHYSRVDLSFIGRRGYAFFKGREQVRAYYEGVALHPDFDKAEQIGQEIAEDFIGGNYDEVYVTYNQFFSPLSQKTVFEKILPIDPHALHFGEEVEHPKEYVFEPEIGSLLEYLVPHFLYFKIYFALLENAAGEHGARMTAMDNATRNAGDMIAKLTLQYNRTRQAAITTELTEIISGAEAL